MEVRTRDDYYNLAAQAIVSGAVRIKRMHEFTQMANSGWGRAYTALALAAGIETKVQIEIKEDRTMSEERQEQYRIHSHLTRSRFLHVEDALEIGKVKLFAGEYKRGQGAQTIAVHYVDVADARVILADLAWGKPIDYCEFKGNGTLEKARSRVLKIKRNEDKVWFRLENGPGQRIGEGAVKPAGEPDAVVNVPLTIWEARRLALAVVAHLDAWEVITFRQRVQGGGR